MRLRTETAPSDPLTTNRGTKRLTAATKASADVKVYVDETGRIRAKAEGKIHGGSGLNKKHIDVNLQACLNSGLCAQS